MCRYLDTNQLIGTIPAGLSSLTQLLTLCVTGSELCHAQVES